MAEDEDRRRRCTRLLLRNTIKRTSTICCIRSIHDLALRVINDNSLAYRYYFHAGELDSLWSEFNSYDMGAFNCLVELNRIEEHSWFVRDEVCELVKVSRAVLARVQQSLRSGAEINVSSDVVRHEPPTVLKLSSGTSDNTRDGGNRGPSGQFSEVLPVCVSTSVKPLVWSRDRAVQSLYRDIVRSECNLLAHNKMWLAKLSSVLGPMLVSPNVERPIILDLFWNGFLPDVIQAVRDVSVVIWPPLSCVKRPSVLKGIICVPPSPPPYVMIERVRCLPCMFAKNTEHHRFAVLSLSSYVPVHRRRRYARSLPSLYPRTYVQIRLFCLSNFHESSTGCVFNRVPQVRTLFTDCYWQHVEMPPALLHRILYWSGTHTHVAYGNTSEWDDSLPSLPPCNVFQLLVVFVMYIVDMTNKWSMYRLGLDVMLRFVDQRCLNSIVVYHRRWSEPSALVVIREIWKSYRLLDTVHNVYVNALIRSTFTGPGIGPIPKYAVRQIIVSRKEMSGTRLHQQWHYYPPIT